MGLFSGVAHAIGGGVKIITGNQSKQKNKGIIGQSYRENVYQQGLRQANTRQSTNESLNARGVLSAGANPGPVGTALQQVAKSGGKKIAGSGVDPFLTAAGQGATGAANTLSGGANQQLTDQFAYEDLGLAKGKSQAEQANTDQYRGIIGNAIADTVKGFLGGDAGTVDGITSAIPNSAMQVDSVERNAGPAERDGGGIMGAYGLPANPSFFSGGPSVSAQGTIIGDGSQANYGFHG